MGEEKEEKKSICPKCKQEAKVWGTLVGRMCSSCIAKFDMEIEESRPNWRC